MAALEAFQLVFPLPRLPATYGRECNDHPLSGQVALLIKTFAPQSFSAEWHWLQARSAEDSRIALIAESLPREELLAIAGDPSAADPSRDLAVLAGYRERFSLASVGARYRARLDELWADREGAAKRLRWRADRSPVGL